MCAKTLIHATNPRMVQNDMPNIDPELLRLCKPGGALAQNPPPRVSIYSRDATSPLESHLYDPVLCMVLQGAKSMRSGEFEVEVRAGDALVVSHHLPVLSQITQASPTAPYVAIVVTLNSATIRELFAQLGDLPAGSDTISAISCAPYDPAWLEPLQRYLAMYACPQDQDILGASVLREIHYRLLLSPGGAILRNIVYRDSHASRIAKAISLIRSEVSAPLRVASLASDVGMSASALHSHFKAVTGTTPLQYQKDLRLITSRGMLERGTRSVASIAFDVGYESPTHFSRDYKRKFGRSPSVDSLETAR